MKTVNPKHEALLLLARLIAKKHISSRQTIGAEEPPNDCQKRVGNDQTLTEDLRDDSSRQEET